MVNSTFTKMKKEPFFWIEDIVFVMSIPLLHWCFLALNMLREMGSSSVDIAEGFIVFSYSFFLFGYFILKSVKSNARQTSTTGI